MIVETKEKKELIQILKKKLTEKEFQKSIKLINCICDQYFVEKDFEKIYFYTQN
tara:strand:- start:137 stop:298 length:162 start_codon:yes stop_codon:yes gene_type:complete